MEGVDDLRDRRNRLRLGQRAWSRFNEVDSVAKTVPLVTSEKEYPILYNRSSDGAAVLVHAEGQFGLAAWADAVEEISGIQRIIAQKLENGTVECVAARLRDNA